MVDGCRVKEQSGGGIEREQRMKLHLCGYSLLRKANIELLKSEAGSETALPFYACFPFVIVNLEG